MSAIPQSQSHRFAAPRPRSWSPGEWIAAATLAISIVGGIAWAGAVYAKLSEGVSAVTKALDKIDGRVESHENRLNRAGL